MNSVFLFLLTYFLNCFSPRSSLLYWFTLKAFAFLSDAIKFFFKVLSIGSIFHDDFNDSFVWMLMTGKANKKNSVFSMAAKV